MKGFVGVTDDDWFAFLSQHQGIDEVNLWQPSADVSFRARHSATKMADKPASKASPSCLNCSTPVALTQPTDLHHVT